MYFVSWLRHYVRWRLFLAAHHEDGGTGAEEPATMPSAVLLPSGLCGNRHVDCFPGVAERRSYMAPVRCDDGFHLSDEAADPGSNDVFGMELGATWALVTSRSGIVHTASVATLAALTRRSYGCTTEWR